MKILVGVLAYQLNEQTIRTIHTQDWDDPQGWTIAHLWGNDIRVGENRFQAVTRKYRELQRLFLASGADVLLTVEQDMVLPPDAITKLARIIEDGADIAYGAYTWRYQNQHWLNAHPRIEEDTHGVPWFWSLTQYPDEARRCWGEPVQVQGLGLGCTMLTRHTLTRLEFRMDRPDHCCDTTLALDAKKEGLIQVADLGVLCGHFIDDHQVIYPDPTTDTLYRIETI